MSATTARATDYYVAANEGDDSWDGQAPSYQGGTHGPWSSLQRINYQGWYPPGSTIMLKRGKTWTNAYATIVNGSGAPGSVNVIGAYDSGDNPKIVGTNNGFNGSIGIYMTVPDYWTIQDIDFHNEYRAILIFLNTTGHSTFTVQRCKFSNDVAYVQHVDGAWPTPAATGIQIEGSGTSTVGADILTHVIIDHCDFYKMGQSIGVNNFSHNDNNGIVRDVLISDCTMHDGSFIQLAAVGAHDFMVKRTKIWNNGVNIPEGPANFVFYAAWWVPYPANQANLRVEDSEIGFNHVCDDADHTSCSPHDGEGIELQNVYNATFQRVLFHHNDATAVLVNSRTTGVQFENCVFAADEAYDVNGGGGCEKYGEFRLHAPLYGSLSGCRFLPRSSLPAIIPQRPFAVSPVPDIPELSGQDYCGGGWHSAPGPSDITYSNTTTSEYWKEVLGGNLAGGASSYQSAQTWEYWFYDPQTTVNTVVLTETPGAGISSFVVRYWDDAIWGWRDAYTGNGIGTDYDRYLPFPARRTRAVQVQVLASNWNWTVGLNGFEVYNANGTNPTDQFLSTTLDQNWSWVRPYGTWNLYNNLGFLRIGTDGQDLWGPGGGSPNSIVLRSASGDWTATTRLQFSPAVDYQQAGIILYGDDDNYVKLVFGHDTSKGGTAVEFTKEWSAENNGQPTQRDKVGVNTPAIFLRLVKSGSNLSGYYSLDGINWLSAGADFWTVPGWDRIGLIAQGATGAYPDFDWFDLTPN